MYMGGCVRAYLCVDIYMCLKDGLCMRHNSFAPEKGPKMQITLEKVDPRAVTCSCVYMCVCVFMCVRCVVCVCA